ncbi:MAG: DUF4258 domain-containing protein [Spirochaetaceae bacterium]|nr:DUF4258 domain-containing protein [Spirochaetaceae bacterium]
MSKTLAAVKSLVIAGEVRVSAHGYDEAAADGLRTRELIQGIGRAVVVEDYPDYPKGPCVLVRQSDEQNQFIHVVWGIPAGSDSPAVIVTAYRPDPGLWTEDYLRRVE